MYELLICKKNMKKAGSTIKRVQEKNFYRTVDRLLSNSAKTN